MTKAALFVTCLVDNLYPEIGAATVEILDHLGFEVTFPAGQSCCGQPGYNAGYWDEARGVAAHFLDVFADEELIVTPSGSCAAMVKHEYPRLFADDPDRLKQAQKVAGNCWELTELLTKKLDISELNASLPQPMVVAIHNACHGLRALDLGVAGRQLVGAVGNVKLAELNGCDSCCGFGGLFSVKMSPVSGAMLDRKIANIEACPASAIVCGDAGCMAHINGGLAKRGSTKRVTHIAELLAAGIREQG